MLFNAELNYSYYMAITGLVIPPMMNGDFGGYSDTRKLQEKFQRYASRVFMPGVHPNDEKRQIKHAQRVLTQQEEWFVDVRNNLSHYRKRWAAVAGTGATVCVGGCILFLLKGDKRFMPSISSDEEDLLILGSVFLATIGALVGAYKGIPYWTWRTPNRCNKGLEQIAMMRKELDNAVMQSEHLREKVNLQMQKAV